MLDLDSIGLDRSFSFPYTFSMASPFSLESLYKAHNVQEIYPGLFISDMMVYKSIAGLKQHFGITGVLNLLPVAEDSKVSNVCRGEGIDFLHLPMSDDSSFPLDSVIERGTDYIERHLKNDGKILVFCTTGTSCSPAMAVAYFMTKCGMTFKEARRCIASTSSINEGFLQQLSRLEGKLPCDCVLTSCLCNWGCCRKKKLR